MEDIVEKLFRDHRDTKIKNMNRRDTKNRTRRSTISLTVVPEADIRMERR